jgi:hypothetical protein
MVAEFSVVHVYIGTYVLVTYNLASESELPCTMKVNLVLYKRYFLNRRRDMPQTNEHPREMLELLSFYK